MASCLRGVLPFTRTGDINSKCNEITNASYL